MKSVREVEVVEQVLACTASTFRRHRMPQRPFRCSQPERADDLRLAGLLLLVDQAQPVVVAQRDDELGQLVVGDAGSQLAVERVGRPTGAAGSGRCPRWPCASSGESNSVPFDLLGVALQPLVGAEAGAGGPPSWPPTVFSSVDDELDAFRTSSWWFSWRGSAGVSGAHSAALKNLELRLGDAVAVLCRPRPARRCPRRCADRRARRAGCSSLRSMRPWSSRRPAAARGSILCSVGISVDGVLPDLVGVGGEVDFGVGVAVEDAGLLVVEVEERLVVRVRPRRRPRRCRRPRRSRASAGGRARAGG